MKHPLKYSSQEKVEIWLDLCDLTFRLMASSLNPEQLENRLHRMREEDVKSHRNFLTRLGKIDS